MNLTTVKRSQILVAAAVLSVLLFVAHNFFIRDEPLSIWRSVSVSTEITPDRCTSPNPFEKTFGRTNIRLSRAYEGSQYRTRQFLAKLLRGEAATVAAIGGSITKGHGVYESEIWFTRLSKWLHETFPSSALTSINGAVPASGSGYFGFCFGLHIPQDVDLVFVELAVNDEGIPGDVDDMEDLLRGLLDLPRRPAVILVEAIAFSRGGMGGGGGRMHLPVARYFDVPVIDHFARYPELVPHYFASDFWGNPDTRHLNARGHHDLAMLVASFFQDAVCGMSQQADGLSNSEAELALPWKQGEEMMPPMWMDSAELGQLPRLRTLDGWNPDLSVAVPHFHPMCLSTRSPDPRFNLTPIASEGFAYWVHPDFLDKPYLLANASGASVSFELDVTVGVVKIYRLRSRSFGLGMASCWVNHDRERAVKVDGFWDNDANVGDFATIRTDLSPGRHTVTCQVLEETSDPGGGHEFRVISLMSL